MSYMALHIKTEYSILDSLISIKDLVRYAKNLGYTSLSICDTNNLFGVYEFYLECNRNNIKPIIGMEIKYENTSFLLYAINNIGYKKLLKINTKLSNGSFSCDDLRDNDNLIVVYPYKDFNKDIFDIFKNRYIGYSNSYERDRIPSSYKKVYAREVRYLDKDDYVYIDYLHLIRDSKVIGEIELNKYKDMYLFSSYEIDKYIDRDSLDNMDEIVNMCNVTLEYKKGLLPIYDKDINSYDYLSMLCNKGLRRRLNDNVSSLYQERLNHELKIINEMGFCDYFLVVWDYVKYAKFNKILVGPGRGSAAGSLVSYTLGITDIDPIKYNLLFERFLNPNRVTMPDIDIDFDNERIDEVINYVISKYGEKKVCGIITFSHLSSKQVIRDVGRILKLNNSVIEQVSKNITYPTLSESINKNIVLKRLINSGMDVKKLLQISMKLEGRVRNISVHAAGIVICNEEVDNVIPIVKNDDMYLTAFTKDYLEPLGLLKMDFLRLSTLNFINEVITNINSNENMNITFEKIPLDDKKTLEIFYNADTDGIFQFESSGMKQFLSKLKVNSFDDLVAAIALFRPGPLSNIDTYIRRKEGLEKIDYIDETFYNILKDTYGIIIYQEQIMQIASVMAGYTYGEADVLRRVISKKDENKLLNEKPKFIDGAIKRGYNKEKAEYVFNLILKFADYGFNKSHSVAYAIIGYKMAFLKRYFLKYFLTSLLTSVIGNEEKTNLYLTSARNNNIKIDYPFINYSTDKYNIKDNSIICPLSIIKEVGKNGCYVILSEREKGEFTSFTDFVVRCYPKGINQKSITSLIYAGCFSKFGYNRCTLINNLDNIINYAKIYDGLFEEPCINIYDEYDRDVLINKEFSVYGFYMFSHPTLAYKNENDINLNDISKYFNKNINVVVLVSNVKEVITKKNEVMAFVYASDNTSVVDITLFPNIYSQRKIKKGDIVRIFGSVERRYDSYQLVAKGVEMLKKKDTSK